MQISRRTRRVPVRSLPALLLAATAVICALAAAPAWARRAPSPARQLAAAAHRSNRADRAFVADAVALERCVHAHPGHCFRMRRALQRAGARLAGAEQRLGRLAYSTGRFPHFNAAHSVAPVLSASGRALSWTQPNRGRTFLLMRRVPGQSVRFSVVWRSTTTTPPPVPGQTVRYAVRGITEWSVWSNEVEVAYPATGAKGGEPGPGRGSGSGSGSGSGTPEGTGSKPEPVDTQAAPTVTASSGTLSWAAVGNVSAYILETAAPSGTTYTAVSGTSVKPAAVPGQTVHYLVRTAVTGSAWSAPVAISYPAEQPVEKPREPAPESSGFQPGLNSGTNTTMDVPGAAAVGAKLVRIEFEIGTSAAAMEPAIAAYAARGIRVLPLAGFYARLPSQAEARNLASWAQTYGPGGSYWATHPGNAEPIQSIEFGNETSYGYQYGSGAGTSAYRERAETYALRAKEAVEAIRAAGAHVGVLAQADDWTGDWVSGMFAAVPNLGSYVAGWTIHPYGPSWRSRIEGLERQTAEHGAPSTLSVNITEWGLATDNGRCLSENYGWNACMSYAEAGVTIARVVGEIRSALGSRAGAFMIYQVRDQLPSGAGTDRESYFGVLQHEDQSKGPFTAAVQAVLAA